MLFRAGIRRSLKITKTLSSTRQTVHEYILCHAYWSHPTEHTCTSCITPLVFLK